MHSSLFGDSIKDMLQLVDFLATVGFVFVGCLETA